MSVWVYILLCADGRYYVGSHRGDNLDGRVADHNIGLRPEAWTFKRRPVVLVWAGDFDRITDAIAFERQVKGWSRAKKEALIAGDWSALRRLAKSRIPASANRGEVAPVLRQAQDEG